MVAEKRQLPIRLFTRGTEPMPRKSMNYHSHMEKMDKVFSKLGMDAWLNLRNSCLGVFVTFYEKEFVFAGRIVQHLLLRQLVVEQPHEIWCLLGDQPVRFSLNEFQHLTGLNCGELPRDDDAVINHHTEFWTMLKLRPNKGPSWASLARSLDECSGWSVRDRTRLGLLSLLSICVFAMDRRVRIPVSIAKMVLRRDTFDMYPWGRLAFMHLIRAIKSADFDKYSLVMGGFVQVLQVWGYWAFHRLGETLGSKRECEGVELTGWKGSRKPFDLDQLLLEDMREYGKVRVTHLHYPGGDLIFPKWGNEAHDPSVHCMIKTLMSLGDRFMPTDWSSEGMKVGNPQPKRETKRKATVSRSLSDSSGVHDPCDSTTSTKRKRGNNVKCRNVAGKSLATTQSDGSNDLWNLSLSSYRAKIRTEDNGKSVCPVCKCKVKLVPCL
ncbi:unnamed protein product [Arabidopsis halleri]